jgi:hypothetical protein
LLLAHESSSLQKRQSSITLQIYEAALAVSRTLGILLALALSFEMAVRAQSVVPDVNTLRTNTYGASASVVLQGYYAVGDGGGGVLASGSTANSCQTTPSQPGTTTNGSPVITFPGGTNLPGNTALGMGITGPGIPTNDAVASFDTTAPTITLITPAGSGAGTGTITLSGDNGGTTIKDISNNCFMRVSSNWSPREWGAKGDGTNDDTPFLQNWINAPQPHIGYIGRYKVFSPLTCPINTTIQGGADDAGSNATTRPFQILAAATFAGLAPGNINQAVLTALDYCRISGVAVDAGGFYLPVTGTTHTSSTSIDGLPSSISGVHIGNAVTGVDIPDNTTVTLVTTSPCCSVTISQAASLGHTETVNFYGPDALDIVGLRVTVDGFSALSGGHYNVNCGFVQADGPQIKDTQIKSSSSDNVHMTSNCANARLIGDIITQAGDKGVVFGGRDLTLADGVVEQSGGIGLDLTGATYASVTGNFFDDNGKGPSGGAAIEINGTSTVSICGNHISGNDEYSTKPAEIRFEGSNDGINLCGNTYAAESQTGDVTLKPDYVYDAAAGTVLTNSHLYETPTPHMRGIYSDNAAKVVAPLQVPRIVPNYLSGFTLSNDASKKINIAPGEAANSSASAIIQNALTCNVDLAASGASGLDSGSVAGSTTYFYYSIAQAGGSMPGCIASTSPSRPSFRQSSSSDYAIFTKYRSVMGSPLLYNVKSVAGIVAGDEIKDDSYIPIGTVVASVGTVTVNQVGSIASDQHTITVADTSQIAYGMAISDAALFAGCSITAQPLIGDGTTILSVTSGTTFTITPNASNTGTISGDCMTVSGGNVIQMSNNAAATTPTTGMLPSAKVFTGAYRLLGALYTDSSSNVIGFAEEGDTFYLKTSVTDIQTGPTPFLCAGTIGTTAQSCALSVPCGRNAACASGTKVEAFGRIVGGTNTLLLSSLDQSDQAPAAFPTAPGYTAKNSAPQVSFPFRLHTDTGGQVRVRASGSATTVYEVTDGWVLHRAQ